MKLPTVIGPVGVGVAVLEDAAVIEEVAAVPLMPVRNALAELEPVAVVEERVAVPLMPVGTVLAGLEPAAVVEVEVEVPLVRYILRRFGPPQYSKGFPEHAMLHCVVRGVAPSTSAEPAWMTFPQ